jgi:hypothetical protein
VRRRRGKVTRGAEDEKEPLTMTLLDPVPVVGGVAVDTAAGWPESLPRLLFLLRTVVGVDCEVAVVTATEDETEVLVWLLPVDWRLEMERAVVNVSLAFGGRRGIVARGFVFFARGGGGCVEEREEETEAGEGSLSTPSPSSSNEAERAEIWGVRWRGEGERGKEREDEPMWEQGFQWQLQLASVSSSWRSFDCLESSSWTMEGRQLRHQIQSSQHLH